MMDMTRPKRRYVKAYPRWRFAKWESVDPHFRYETGEHSRFHSDPDQLDFGF